MLIFAHLYNVYLIMQRRLCSPNMAQKVGVKHGAFHLKIQFMWVETGSQYFLSIVTRHATRDGGLQQVLKRSEFEVLQIRVQTCI